MIPKDKAKELIEKYKILIDPNDNNEIDYLCKQCALIAVDEMINSFESMANTCHSSMPYRDINLKIWQEVKQEINKI